MTQSELYSELLKIGLPVAYNHFSADENSGEIQLPNLTYFLVKSNDLFADDYNYISIATFAVELNSESKNLEEEKLVEDKLKELGITYFKSEKYVKEINVYQVHYEFQII